MKSPKSDLLSGEFVCRSEDATFELGERFGATLAGGEIVLLSGELGAGKTLFVKGVMNALGYDVDEVTSPSFTLVNIYAANLKVFHLDLYRLSDGVAAGYAVDLDDLLSDETAVIIIEWAERLQNFPLPSVKTEIIIAGDGDAPRTIKITNYE